MELAHVDEVDESPAVLQLLFGLVDLQVQRLQALVAEGLAHRLDECFEGQRERGPHFFQHF
jgi:hypothetical protein